MYPCLVTFFLCIGNILIVPYCELLCGWNKMVLDIGIWNFQCWLLVLKICNFCKVTFVEYKLTAATFTFYSSNCWTITARTVELMCFWLFVCVGLSSSIFLSFWILVKTLFMFVLLGWVNHFWSYLIFLILYIFILISFWSNLYLGTAKFNLCCLNVTYIFVVSCPNYSLL